MADMTTGSLFQVGIQIGAIGWMGTGIDDFFCPFQGAYAPKVSPSLFGHHNLDGMLIVVHMGGHENGQITVPGKFSAAPTPFMIRVPMTWEEFIFP